MLQHGIYALPAPLSSPGNHLQRVLEPRSGSVEGSAEGTLQNEGQRPSSPDDSKPPLRNSSPDMAYVFEGFNFTLPTLPVHTPFKDRTKTDVKILDCLVEDVSFVPWDEMDSTVEDVRRRILRRMEKAGTDESGRFSARRKKDVEDVIKDVSRLREIVERCREEHLPMDDKAQPMTQETEDDVDFDRAMYTHIFDSLQPTTKKAKVEEELSDSVKDGEDGKERGDETEESTECAKESKEEDHAETITPEVPVENREFTSFSSAAPIFSRFFDLLPSLVRISSTIGLHSLNNPTYSSEVGRVFDKNQMRGGQIAFPILPDSALSFFQEYEPGRPPLVTFEMKGPNKDLTGLQRGRKRSDRAGCPLPGMEYVPGDAKLPPPLSAQEMVELMNMLFNNSEYQLSGHEMQIRLPIAQALTQGLISTSGCCALYNHQNIVLFWIEPTFLEETGKDGKERKKLQKTTIHVSRCYPCDSEPGTLLAAVALVVHALGLVKDKEVPLNIRELLNILTARKKRKIVGSASKVEPKEDREGDGGSGEGSKDNGNAHRGNGKRGDNKAQDDGGEDDGSMADSKKQGRQESSGNTEGRKCNDKERTAHKSFASDGLQCGQWLPRFTNATDEVSKFEILSEAIQNGKGEVAIGSSGFVLLGEMNGDHVALKFWNGENAAGKADLLREISLYKIIRDNSPDLLGSAIPDLKFISELIPDNPFIVTSYVGRGLQRLSNGALGLVGEFGEVSVELPHVDVVSIAQASLHSLTLLHNAGILHGDVDLRNLRVKRERSLKCKNAWMAWWVDLGRAVRAEKCDKSEVQNELLTCESMFSEVDLSDISDSNSDVQYQVESLSTQTILV